MNFFDEIFDFLSESSSGSFHFSLGLTGGLAGARNAVTERSDEKSIYPNDGTAVEYAQNHHNQFALLGVQNKMIGMFVPPGWMGDHFLTLADKDGNHLPPNATCSFHCITLSGLPYPS